MRKKRNTDITNPNIDARSSLMKEEPGYKNLTNPGIHAGVEGPPLIGALALQLLKLPDMDPYLPHNEGLNGVNFGIIESRTMKSSLGEKDITNAGLDARSPLMKEEPGNKDITNPGIHTRSSLMNEGPVNKDLTNPGIHAGVEGLPLIGALALHLLKLSDMNHRLMHNEDTRSFLMKEEPGNKDLTNPGIHAGVEITPSTNGL